MNCTQVDRMLDDLMDGVLSDADLRELEAHCANCETCAVKLSATREMMQLFSEMDDEVDVPLQAQARWRSAVKAEARKGGMKRFYRMGAGIAAVLVVALGATFALRSRPTELPKANLTAGNAAMVPNMAMIEADGQSDEMLSEEESIDTAVSRGIPMHEIAMTVESLDATCEYMADLVSEYEGSLDQQRFEEDGRACANLYIELPAGNIEEFLNAASHYDVDGGLELPTQLEAEGEQVSVLLVLKEA